MPSDSVQVDTTWQYVNVKGGPDRRYKNNRKLPVMEYAELTVRGNGLQHVFLLSNVQAAMTFARRLNSMRTARLVPSPSQDASR